MSTLDNDLYSMLKMPASFSDDVAQLVVIANATKKQPKFIFTVFG
jgi:hypothetical protein